MRLTRMPTLKNIVVLFMMKLVVVSVLFVNLMCIFVFTAASAMPAGRDGTPELLNLTRKLLTNPPALMPAPAKQPNPKPFVGSRRTFYAIDVTAGYHQYSAPATCRAVGKHCYIFVEDTAWQRWVTASDVEALKTAFDEKTPADAQEGIYTIETTSLGPLPDVDSDPKIYILVLDIRDGYPRGGDSYIAGYFNPLNQYFGGFRYNNEIFYSNEIELIYLDAYPLDAGSLSAQGVLAHEFQHIIHWNVDASEELWVNEGASEYAMFLCGYSPTEHIRAFERNPSISLVDWSDELANYGAAYLWFLYLHERYGSAFISTLINNSAQGIEGINSTLTYFGYSETFEQIFCDWKIANLLDDTSLAGSKYGYETVQVNIDFSHQHRSYPANAIGNLNSWSADYLKFMLSKDTPALFSNAGLELSFSCPPNDNFDVRIVPVKGNTRLEIYAMAIDRFTGKGEITLPASLDMDEVMLIPSWHPQSVRMGASRVYSYSARLIDSFVATSDGNEKGQKLKYEEAEKQFKYEYEKLLAMRGMRSHSAIPSRTSLLANFPNPFNPETWIPYQLSEAADVTIYIYNNTGRFVRKIALGEKPAGFYHTPSSAAYWDGRDASGQRVASGVYFYTIRAGRYTATRKMVLIE